MYKPLEVITEEQAVGKTISRILDACLAQMQGKDPEVLACQVGGTKPTGYYRMGDKVYAIVLWTKVEVWDIDTFKSAVATGAIPGYIKHRDP